jgi:rubrerythrin
VHEWRKIQKGGIFEVSIAFSGSELINIAIGIERRGVTFYDIMARSTENATARDMFQYLANMEGEHIQIFKGMLAEDDKFQILETYAGEYGAYFQALVDSAVFTDDLVASEMATETNSDIKGIELAIGAEKDSILFYYEMKDIMPHRAQPTVNKIIVEEKSHLRQLSELKKKLANL